jgi:hypothetical protein
VTVGLPERFEIDEGGGALRICWKWPKAGGIVLGIFAVGWDGFLLSWYQQALAVERPSAMMLLFPLAHVAVGLVLPYLAIACFLNTTKVEVSAGELRVAHGPLPFPGNRTLRVNEIRQLFCVERTGKRGSRTYNVMAQLTSSRELTLVHGLTSDREARFLEQRIESRLGLANQPVSGELHR